MWARGGPGSAEILRSCQGGWGPTRERNPRKNNPEWYSTARELDGPRCTNQSRGPDSSRSSHTCAEVCDHRGDRWPAVVPAGAQRPSLGSCRVACSEDVAAFGTPPLLRARPLDGGAISVIVHSWSEEGVFLCTRGARGSGPWRSWRHAGVTSVVLAAAACNAGVRNPSWLSPFVLMTGVNS